MSNSERPRIVWPFILSVFGLGVALLSGIESDIFHIFPHGGLLSLVTFVPGIALASLAWIIGVFINQDWIRELERKQE